MKFLSFSPSTQTRIFRRQNHDDAYLTSPYMMYWGVGMPGAYPGGVAAWGESLDSNRERGGGREEDFDAPS